MLGADKFQLHMFAALAEQERKLISQCTKTALKAAKKQGTKSGVLRDKTSARNKANMEIAQKRAEELRTIITPMHTAGMSLQQIASALNVSGHRTNSGADYNATQISRLIKRSGL